MRVLIFHGYLLSGTGSNIYNANLARTLAALGHDVHLLCQDRRAGELDFVHAAGDWREGALVVRPAGRPSSEAPAGEPGAGRCTAYVPDIGGVLPLYVADEYEGFDSRPFSALEPSEVERYVHANVLAVRDVADRARPDIALANHLVMGPVILARALAGRVPYAVKVHGSALEYTVRPQPERFLPFAREGLSGAACVLVGSRHTAESLWEVVGEESLAERTRLGPPGVETARFRPRSRADAAARLGRLADRLESAPGGWGAEAGAADALRCLDPGSDRIVGYVGKLIVSKGVDLLLAAWPLVYGAVPGARLCIVGFGAYRDGLERLLGALETGDLDELRELASRGRELEGGPAGELSHLAAFLDGLEGAQRAAYLSHAPGAARRVHFTGGLDHADLAEVLPAFEVQVVPSTFPEAFGMVAVEAAACGAFPISSAHSGLAEVSAVLAEAIEPELGAMLSFERGPGAVAELAERLIAWMRLGASRRSEASHALATLAAERFGWEAVARGVISAARGELDALARPIATGAASGA